MPDKTYVRLLWWLRMDYPLNLKRPKTYNEKLQWLKIYYKDPRLTLLADKYSVRNFISSEIGDKYLVPLIGVYENVDEIEWEKLPGKFVLKCTHDSGSSVICSDKSKFDKNAAIKKLSNRMRNNTTYKLLREWPYKNIKRRIICEKYLSDERGELKDYKIYCFDGEPKVMVIVSERHLGKLKLDFYDLQLNYIDLLLGPYKQSGKELSKPRGFEEMIRLSKILSRKLPHVRVDFYDIDGRVYFGEMTFFTTSGLLSFTPRSIDELWGSWIKIPTG